MKSEIQLKREKVAIEHANYLVRQAGYNCWGNKAMKEMVERIIERHISENTPEHELDKIINEYENLKKK